MPRSRGQKSDPDPHLISTVLAADKRLGTSLKQLKCMLKSDGQSSLPVAVQDSSSLPDGTTIELNIYARNRIPSSWRASFKINRMCVGGADHHVHEVPASEGTTIRRWHRDRYEPAAKGMMCWSAGDPAPDGKIRMMNVSPTLGVPDEQLELGFDP